MTTVRIPPHACPSCEVFVDAIATSLKDIVPRVGDVTVCYHCGEVLVLEPDADGDLRLRLMRSDELLALPETEREHLVRLGDLTRSTKRMQ